MTAIEDLSLLGLFSRIEEIDQLKAYNKSDKEDQAVIASEGSVKKLIATEIGAAPSTGLGSTEKAKAKDFLQAQLKAVDPLDKHASLRREKISELLQGVEQAAGREAPEHVKRGKDALARVKRESKDINETYAKWEKGKVMFKTNDELKAMQKQHADMEKCLEATQTFVDDMLKLARSDARPPPLPVQGSSAARPKAKTATRVADPTVRVGAGGGGGGGGYPSAKARSTPSAMVNNAALRQAQLAAELRAADAEPEWASEPPRAPKPPRIKQEEPDNVVLSYSCTCKAVSEICGISVDRAKDLAESSRDFQKHLNPSDWLLVRDRSVAIEKENKEREREKEQQKKAKAQNRLTEKLGQTVSAAATVQISSNRSAVPGAAPVAKSAGVKPKPAPKKPPKNVQSGLAQKTAFSGLQSDSDDDGGGGGWSKVGR